jgi:sugar lactone lactonase YvrE
MFALSLSRKIRSTLAFRLHSRCLQSLTISQPWLNTRCSLGEGPFWEEETNTIRFLDIEKQKLMRVDLNKGPSSLETVKEHDISMG